VKLSPDLEVTGFFSSSTSPRLSNDEVLNLYEDGQGDLWICTQGGGVNRLVPRTGAMRYYTKLNGLPGNIAYGIIGQGDDLWISTDKGLARLSRKNDRITAFTVRNGITDNEFNTASFFRGSNGRLFFGSINGITSFDPAQIRRREDSSDIVLTGYSRYDGESRSVTETVYGLKNMEPVRLGYLDHSATFSFTLDNFEDPAQNRFAYLLEGLTPDWNVLGHQRVLRLGSLPAGSYLLRIKGYTPRGSATMNELRIPIVVGEAFYKTWWFTACVFLTVAILIYAVFRNRIIQLEKLQLMRTRIASDLHDEVGSLLTRISIHTELIKHTRDNTSARLEEIAETSRLATATMSDVLWSVDSRNDRSGNLVDRMREHADQMLQPANKAVIFEHNLDTSRAVGLIVRQQLFLIFKEAINNIVKHSTADTVYIGLHNEHRKFLMRISDNGSPRAAPGRTGQGMKNMKMRAEKLGAVLTVEREGGYRITLVMEAL
jgi:two-component sensor histidine kinase